MTKDFLLLSQPLLHEGILVVSASSGRRLYVHHLSEIPLSEVYRTRLGNQCQLLRVDAAKLTVSAQWAVPIVTLTIAGHHYPVRRLVIPAIG